MILITGAGGTVGLALIDKLLKNSNHMPILALDNNQEACAHLNTRFGNQVSIFEMDINDPAVSMLFQDHKITTIIHLAASKNIVNSEKNVSDTIQTNLYGLDNLLSLSTKHDVSQFIFTSSDKAANAKNILGMSKFIGEGLVSEYASKYEKNYFSIRYGNIIGSSHSVVPVIIQQIQDKQTITVTDTGMTRFIMTIFDAVQTIIDSQAFGKSGDIIIPNMQKVKVIDLIESAWNKYGDGSPFQYQVTGKRKNENMHEEIISENEYATLTSDEKYWVIKNTSQNNKNALPKDLLSSAYGPYLLQSEIAKIL